MRRKDGHFINWYERRGKRFNQNNISYVEGDAIYCRK
jgi:hypothetical protein